MDEKEKSNKKQKKKVAKAYEQYASEFTPKPKYELSEGVCCGRLDLCWSAAFGKVVYSKWI